MICCVSKQEFLNSFKPKPHILVSFPFINWLPAWEGMQIYHCYLFSCCSHCCCFWALVVTSTSWEADTEGLCPQRLTERQLQPGWQQQQLKNIKWQEIRLKNEKRRCGRQEGGKVLNCKEIVCLLLYAMKTLFYFYIIHSLFWRYDWEWVDTPPKLTCVITNYEPGTQGLDLIWNVHRIPQYSELEGTCKYHWVQLLTLTG